MAESNHIALYRSVVEEGFSKGNLSVVDRVVSPNLIEHETVVNSGGADGLKQAIQMFRTAFPDLRMTVEDVWEVGDRVIGRCRCTGTHNGPMGDIQPTGKKVDVEAIDIVRFSGDKMAEHWGVTDRMTMMEQLGLVPQMQHG